MSERVGHLDTTMMGPAALIFRMGQLLRYSVTNKCHSYKTGWTLDTAIMRLTALMMSLGKTFGCSMLNESQSTAFFFKVGWLQGSTVCISAS